MTMSISGRTFTVASDEALVELISLAHRRLVVIAPALTQPVADALSCRLRDLGELDVMVVLDSDPEVYRLGFGDLQALETIRAASIDNLFDLREQPGVRIGVVISDETTLIYAPVSRNVEAGSTSTARPNAIVLSGDATRVITKAAGSDRTENAGKPEIGNLPLLPEKVQAIQADLKANPARPFDITRKLNVFTSKVQYVEFSVSNYRLTTRQIPLPPELIELSDEELKNRITSKIRAPFDDIGKLDVTIEWAGKTETLKIDDKCLGRERKRIEDEYKFQIANFGRVILSSDREAFENATGRFQAIVENYQAALHAALLAKRTEFEKRIVDEFAGRWTQTPPAYFARWGIKPTPEKIGTELRRLAGETFDTAVEFDPPTVKKLYKSVAPENIQDSAFLEGLERIMVKRRVPRDVIDSLFESGHAAPESGSFLAR